MEHRQHNPDANGPFAELPELLRTAVVQVREDPVPEAASQRALTRARHIDPTPPARPWLTSRFSLLATGAVAALLFFSLRAGLPPVDGHRAQHPPENGESNQLVQLDSHRDSIALDFPVFSRPRHSPFANHDVLPVSLGQSGWERVGALRELASGMPPIDRHGIEEFLRQLSVMRIGLMGGKKLVQPRVRDNNGQEAKLLGLRIQISIEGPRARTIIDHTFRNSDESSSGTFECALPDGASPSYFAVNPGSNGTAKVIYPSQTAPALLTTLPHPEKFVGRIDPNCFGQPRRAVVARFPRAFDQPDLGGGLALQQEGQAVPCFSAPVGPLRRAAFFRVVLAYEETLPIRNGKLVYHLPLTASVNHLSLDLQIDSTLAKSAKLDLDDAKSYNAGGKTVFVRSWSNQKPPEAVHFEAPLEDARIQTTSGRDGDSRYLLARVRPEIPEGEASAPFARHAVFLLDTSAGENPQRLDLCVQLIRSILEKDSEIEQFGILTFATGAAWLDAKGLIANTKHNRDAALAQLAKLAREGATDFGSALDALAKVVWSSDEVPFNAFLLSDGQSNWGESDPAALVARFEATCPRPIRWHCYRTGLGAENAELFAQLTRRNGGVYRVANADDLDAVSLAHRRRCLVVDRVGFHGSTRVNDILIAGRCVAVHPGGELLLGARFANPGRATLVLEGTLDGKRVAYRYPVTVSDDGELAPRAWAEIAVSSLLANNDPELEPLAVAYARKYRIASRVTAFAWGKEVETVTPTTSVAVAVARSWRKRGGEELGSRAALRWLLLDSVPNEKVRKNLAALFATVRDEDLTGLDTRVAGALAIKPRPGTKTSPEELLEPESFLEQARQRADKDVGGAIRLLSGLVERSDDRSNAVRIVAHRMIGMGESARAVPLLLAQTRLEPHDPTNHRILGMALVRSGKPAWAALHYETALTQMGDQFGWHHAVRAEYASLLAEGTRDVRLRSEVREQFRDRLKELENKPSPADLCVRVTWASVGADVALELTKPDGKVTEKKLVPQVGYRQGPCSLDLVRAEEGAYRVAIELTRGALQSPETLVLVEVIRYAGTAAEKRERRVILLRKRGDRSSFEIEFRRLADISRDAEQDHLRFPLPPKRPTLKENAPPIRKAHHAREILAGLFSVVAPVPFSGPR